MKKITPYYKGEREPNGRRWIFWGPGGERLELDRRNLLRFWLKEQTRRSGEDRRKGDRRK
jgi:hypothetical protein